MNGFVLTWAVSPRHPARSAAMLALAFSVLWALLEVVAGRLHGRYHVVQVEACRFAVQLLLVLALWAHRGGMAPWRTKRPGLQLGRAGMMLAVPLGFGLAVSLGATVPTVLAGLWLAPLLTLGLATRWLRDPVPPLLWASVAAGCLGAVLLLGPEPALSLRLLVVPVLMGMALALYLAMTRVLRHEPTSANLFYVAFGCLLLLVPLLPAVWVWPSLRDAMLLAGIGILGHLGLWLLEEALRRWSLAELAPVFPVQVVCLVLLTGAQRTPGLITGCGLVGAALIGVWFRAQAHDRAGAFAANGSVLGSRLPGPNGVVQGTD